MLSTLDTSSPDLLQQSYWNVNDYYASPSSNSRLFHLPKSRSQLHHHHLNHLPASSNPNRLRHHHHQHHHQPSWSSSLSAFSLQRTSAFLIDEYGNEHDPEHCQFKTLAAPPTRRSASSSSTSSNRSVASSSSSSSSRPPPSRRSSFRSLGPSHISPCVSAVHSSYHPRPLERLNRCLPSMAHHKKPTAASPTVGPIRTDTHTTNGNSSTRWKGKIWSHLLRPTSTSTSSSIRSNHPSPNPSSPHNMFNKKKKKRKLSSPHSLHFQETSPQPHRPPINHHNLCGMRKRLELVKLEFRFGILRTRKRFVGVWKK